MNSFLSQVSTTPELAKKEKCFANQEPLLFTKAHVEKSHYSSGTHRVTTSKEEISFNNFKHLQKHFIGSSSLNENPMEYEEMDLHQFIELNNLKSEKEEDDNEIDYMDDEDYLEKQEEEQKAKKKNKRKKNKKKKKLQQQLLKQQSETVKE